MTYYATDHAGNTEAVQSKDIKIDKTAIPSQASATNYSNTSPITVNYSTTNAAGDTSGLAKVELWAKGPGDSAYSKVGEKTTASGSFSYTVNQGDGDYRFYTISEDNAGNREVQPPSANAIVTVTQDTAAPTTTASARNTDNTDYTFGTFTKQNVTVTLSADDGSGSGVDVTRYTTDGSTPSATNGAIYNGAFTISTEYTTTVKFLSIDQAGNAEAVQSKASGSTSPIPRFLFPPRPKEPSICSVSLLLPAIPALMPSPGWRTAWVRYPMAVA